MERKSSEFGLQMVELRREHFMLGLLSGSYNNAGARREATRLGVPSNGYQYACLLAVGDTGSLTEMLIDPAGLLQEALRQYGRSPFAIALPDKTILGILAVPHSKPDFDGLLREAADDVKKRLSNATEAPITVAIGGLCHDLAHLHETYTVAQQVMHLREYLGGNRVLSAHQLREPISCRFHSLPDKRRLSAAVRKGSLMELQQMIDEVVEEFQRNAALLRPLDYKALFLEMASTLSKSVDVSCQFLSTDTAFFESLSATCDAESVKEHLNTYAHSLFRSMGDIRKSKKRLQIETALTYMQEHYAENITLGRMADLCELSTSYFCKLFKNETGESFADYLTWLRIEKSIELLSNPKTKVYEIAQAVGYNDIQYFNKVFRTITGVSPTFYRNNLLISQDEQKNKIS